MGRGFIACDIQLPLTTLHSTAGGPQTLQTLRSPPRKINLNFPKKINLRLFRINFIKGGKLEEEKVACYWDSNNCIMPVRVAVVDEGGWGSRSMVWCRSFGSTTNKLLCAPAGKSRRGKTLGAPVSLPRWDQGKRICVQV